jgi:archaetidylinositol phosphate synthase
MFQMIDSKWGKKSNPILTGIAKVFIFLHIKPNTITILALIVGLLAGACIATERPILAIIFLWLSGLLDVVDGSVARLTGNSSRVGAYLDLISDRMVEAGVILGFAWVYPEYYFVYLLFFVAVLFNFSTFLAAGALYKNTGVKSMHYDVGIAERTETFIIFTLMLVVTQYIFQILMVFNLIIFLTGILRTIKVIKNGEME